MASTHKIKTEVTDQQKDLVSKQLEQLTTQLKQKLGEYEKYYGKPYHIQLKESIDYDYINPTHYVGDDGKQTWERMVDKWGNQLTAIWCEMTAFKYIDTRIGKKPNEDSERELKKVEWYEKKATELYALAEEEMNELMFENIQNYTEEEEELIKQQAAKPEDNNVEQEKAPQKRRWF